MASSLNTLEEGNLTTHQRGGDIGGKRARSSRARGKEMRWKKGQDSLGKDATGS